MTISFKDEQEKLYLTTKKYVVVVEAITMLKIKYKKCIYFKREE